MASPYDDLGPRIDLDQPQTEPAGPDASHLASAVPPPPPAPRGGRGLALVSLVVALAALALAAWAVFGRPEPVAGPPLSPEVVPGGTAERVAKLEKDVGQLMLRLVTLEKELQSLANKAGTVTQLTELNAKVAALQDRLDNLVVEKRLSSLAARKRPGAGAAPASSPAGPATKTTPRKSVPPAAKPAAKTTPSGTAALPPKPAPKKKLKRKKLTYVVRRGDTLFTIAQRYKVRMKDLMRWNGLKRGQVIKVGERLVIYK